MMNKIALIYMGGTFGCVGEPLAPLAATEFLPLLQQQLPTHLNIHCFPAPRIQDSSAYTAVDWLLLIQYIQNLQCQNFQHFIILHGTDTLSYAAATLSRFLQQSCHVIVTGSQQPLLNIQGTHVREKTDASANLITALNAIQTVEAGIYVAFYGQILHAASSLKIHTTDLNAFASQSRKKTQQHSQAAFIVHDKHLQRAEHLSIINWMMQPIHATPLNQALQSLFTSPPHFLILQGYGSGNLAVNDEIQQTLQQLYTQGCGLILNTQVPFGELQQQYAISDWMNHAPILHSDAESHADLYAKILKMYLQYDTVDQWYAHWY